MAKANYWQRLQRQRITRRRLMVGAGVGVAGLAVAAACGDGGGNGTSPTATTAAGATAVPAAVPKRGGRYKAVTSVSFDTLDPHISIAGATTFFPRLYNVLMNRSPLNPDFLLYDLAADGGLETPDETTYIFTIRPGVKIAPNDLGVEERDMDAEDCRVSMERIEGLPEANACAFVCEFFASHEATEPMVYKVETPGPYTWFLFNIGRFINMVMPRELIQQDDPALIQRASAGAGPFVVREGGFTPGEKLSLERNTNYYGTDPNNNNEPLPYIDGIDSLIIADRSTQRSAFIDQQIHEYGAANIDDVNELTGQYDVNLTSEEPTWTYISFSMNVDRPPFDNPKIRQAANLALNRQEYVDRVYSGEAKINGLVHWPVRGTLSEAELAEVQPFDPVRARELIKEATGEDTVDIKVMFPASFPLFEHDLHLQIFVTQMEEAGFRLNQDPQSFPVWLENYTNKNYDSSLAVNQTYETAEIPLDWQHSKGPAGSGIYANGLQDTEVDAAIEASKTVTDPDELIEAIKQVQRLIYEKGPSFLPLVTPFSRTLRWDFVKDYPNGLGPNTNLLIHDWSLDLPA
ncbi:MAG: ABC transporter substrate-binding protein [Chloroflexi bacterium]|nr:ABC transporter substrate-binding protein [Chloroflexota bacterium]